MKRKCLLFISVIILLMCIGVFLYFMQVRKVKGNYGPVESELSYEVMDWQHNYYVLLEEFMAGGFPVNEYIYYPDGDAEKFCFTLLDMNDDGMPELLIRYNYYWSVFQNANTYEDAYVGEIVSFDDETKDAFSDFKYPIEGMKVYRYDGSELVLDYRSKVEREKINTQYLADKFMIEGKRLSVENMHSELGVKSDWFQEEVAIKGYIGLLHYRKNYSEEYRNAKYALIDVCPEGPVLVCVNEGILQFCFYSDGRLVQLEQEGYGAEKREYSYYPHRNMVRESERELGNYKEMFFYMKDGAMQEVFSAVQEPIYGWGGLNSYKKDLFGNVKYNYFINNQIVSKRKYEKQRNEFMTEYNLNDKVVSIKKDVTFVDYADMKERLENTISAH